MEVSQWSLSAVSAQDFLLAGASPKYSATLAFASGEMMWFIHMYMQLGCLALEEIIQVSDHPVEPSLGSTTFTGVGSCRRSAGWR